MTLLELLRQELPKRGGWPEGYEFVSTNGYGAVWTYKTKGCTAGRELYFHSTKEGHVTREQYEATGWDGTGLPPVGVECERSWCGDKWLACKILFISDETVVVKLATREAAYGRCEVSFRPLRTEAERAIDEMVQLPGVSTGVAKILYDAGYRK